jgi:hypothetical protein
MAPTRGRFSTNMIDMTRTDEGERNFNGKENRKEERLKGHGRDG